MNPSWLNGMMPESMYRHEHPEHVEEAKQETEKQIRDQMAKLRANGDVDPVPPGGAQPGPAGTGGGGGST